MSELTHAGIAKRFPIGTLIKFSATIVHVEPDDYRGDYPVQIQMVGAADTEWLTYGQLHHVEIASRPITRGDTVRWKESDISGEVIHAEGNNAWVRISSATSTENVIAHVSDLEAA